MTSIKELREQLGSEPVDVRTPLLVEVSGHRFGLYLAGVSISQEMVSGNVFLDSGAAIPMNLSRAVEELFERKKMYVHVHEDHLDFYTSEQHVGDYRYSRQFFDEEVKRIAKARVKEVKDVTKRLKKAQGSYDKIKAAADGMADKLVTDRSTPARYEKLDRLDGEIKRFKAILDKKTIDKPNDSFKISIMKNRPIPLMLDVLGSIGDEERNRFLRLYGMVPTKELDVQVEGLLRAKVLLRQND